mmetsp:Transcript_62884/g.140194  ORF Transcript_62884/g.140194 Transcript_62884/m.140194 type:complete len:318 (-) Transcript_62884:302-1255(-)
MHLRAVLHVLAPMLMLACATSDVIAQPVVIEKKARGRFLKGGRGGGGDEEGFGVTMALIFGLVSVPFISAVCVGIFRYRRQLMAVFPEVPAPTNEKVSDTDRLIYKKVQERRRERQEHLREAAEAQEAKPGPTMTMTAGNVLDVQAIFKAPTDTNSEEESLFERTLDSKASKLSKSSKASKSSGSTASQAPLMTGPWMAVSRMRSMSDGNLHYPRRLTQAPQSRTEDDVDAIFSRSQPMNPKAFLRPPQFDTPNSKKSRSRNSSKGSTASGGSGKPHKARSRSKGSSRSSPRDLRQEGGLEILSGHSKPRRPRLHTG